MQHGARGVGGDALVDLVHHQHAQPAHLEQPRAQYRLRLLHVGDDDLRRLRDQPLTLALGTRAVHQGHDEQPIRAASCQLPRGASHLRRQLPRRQEHERLHR